MLSVRPNSVVPLPLVDPEALVVQGEKFEAPENENEALCAPATLLEAVLTDLVVPDV